MITFKQFLYENWFDKNDNTHLSRRKSFDEQLGKTKSPVEIKRYIKDSKPVNNALLSGDNHPDVNAIDSFIEKNKIPTKLHVYSALGKNAHETLLDKKQTPTYLSSTPHKDVAKGYAVKSDDGYYHIAHIVLPEKASAVHVGGHENEVIIGRNQKFQYHDSTTVEEGDKKYKIHKLSL
jgi:hypothetical protein